MAVQLKFEVTGLENLFKQMEGFKDALKNKIMRTAFTKAGRLLKNEVKRRTPKLFGFAKKSIISKVKTYPKTGTVILLIGPDKSKKVYVVPKQVYRMIHGKVVPLRNPVPRPMPKSPVKYYHLLERGFTRVDGKQFPPVAPLRKSWDHLSQMVEKKVVEEVEAGIAKIK